MNSIIFSDVHLCTYASIVRERGDFYSKRLEYLIKSMNWVNELALKYNCEAMFCAGDMLDKATMTDEELTAQKEINWNNLPCYFLCGNHESSVLDLHFNSLKSLESTSRIIINKPEVLRKNGYCILFLPYIAESVRLPLKKYLEILSISEEEKQNLIIISHNDLSGINYGLYTSRDGFSIQEIENNCALFLNGHLHNSEWVTDKILNIGSLSAHNFSNDSFKYKYGVWILNTDTKKVEFIENPYSFNFYQIDINKPIDLDRLNYIKQNSVLSIKANQNYISQVTDKLNTCADKIITSRIILKPFEEVAVENNIAYTLSNLDYLKKFTDFCKLNIKEADVQLLLEDELSKICR